MIGVEAIWIAASILATKLAGNINVVNKMTGGLVYSQNIPFT